MVPLTGSLLFRQEWCGMAFNRIYSFSYFSVRSTGRTIIWFPHRFHQFPRNGPELRIFFKKTQRIFSFPLQCVPVHGLGFRRGSYKCMCKDGYYFPDTSLPLDHRYYNGSVIEHEYERFSKVSRLYMIQYFCNWRLHSDKNWLMRTLDWAVLVISMFFYLNQMHSFSCKISIKSGNFILKLTISWIQIISLATINIIEFLCLSMFMKQKLTMV